jgi:trehalose-6-phosphate synthase
MLTTENIQQLKKEWYSFEDIQSIIRGLENSEKWEILSEEVLWDTIYSEINNNIKQAQWIS